MENEVLGYFIFCGVGRLLIFLIQKSYPSYKVLYNEFLDSLIGCDLCFGVWVFSLLAFVFKMNFFAVPIIGEILTGMVTSFIVHLIYHGWKAQYQIVHIE